MRRRISLLVRLARVLVPSALVLAAAAADAGPVVVAAAAYVGPAYGGRWVGGPYYRPYYRPWVGPVWGGWRYGYPGYGYPGYGYPAWGWGYGFGYGAGWAIATSPAWGWPAPAAAYVMPSWVPLDVAVPAPLLAPSVAENGAATAPPATAAPQVPQAAAQQPGYWYYCTEPAGYYPYVNECSRPWIAVQPTSR